LTFGVHYSWFVVFQFYVCVHLVEAILATTNAHSGGHKERRTNIFANSRLFSKEFRDRYMYLYDISKLARYEVTRRLSQKRLDEAEKCFSYILDFAKDSHGIEITLLSPVIPSTGSPTASEVDLTP